MEFKFGCDPEMFIMNKVTKEFVSAHGLFPGNKRKPHEVECGAVQVDGLAFEFNINPVETLEEWEKNISTVLKQVDEMITDVDKDLTRVFVPFAKFDPTYFDSLPDESKILGCDPDYNGLTGQVKDPPEIGNQPFRTAAGHIHIGWGEFLDPHDPIHNEDCRFVSAVIGNMNFRPHTNEEYSRLYYYGSQYAYRPKPYGVEIRFPSNLWVSKEHTRAIAFNCVKNAMEKMAAA